MSKKSAKIADLIKSCEGQALDAHYLGYFKCFNQGLYYEAHDVLEELWLADKQGANYSFYKGLIQLAGAFVHLQKNRLQPSLALFNLAKANLLKYPALHEQLDVKYALNLIAEWSVELENGAFTLNPLGIKSPPTIDLAVAAKMQIGTILIATRNKHKVQEIREILGETYAYLTLAELAGSPEVVEDAPTFAANSQKKSVELARWMHSGKHPGVIAKHPLYILADDSGLEVDALNGAPGVFSARFAALDSGKNGNSSDADNNAKLLRLLKDVDAAKRTARFRCVLALTLVTSPETVERDWTIQLFDGSCEGLIATNSAGSGGFGYDPLFVPNGFQCSFSELGEAIKNKLSHRSKALQKLVNFLNGKSK